MVQGIRNGSRAGRVEEMRGLVAEFEESGESQVGFCRGHGIPLSTFAYWRRRIRSDVPAPSPFVELQLVDEPSGAPVEIALPGGAVARIGSGASEDLIRRVLRAAGSSC